MTDAELEAIERNIAACKTILTGMENELRHHRVMQKYTTQPAAAFCSPESERSHMVGVDGLCWRCGKMFIAAPADYAAVKAERDKWRERALSSCKPSEVLIVSGGAS